MSENSIVSKILVIATILIAIVVPVFTGEPLDKFTAIFVTVSVVAWGVTAAIADVKSSVDNEAEIAQLKARVKELENKNK